ncbi:MAG: hypothetical protein AAGU12_07620 [Clostridiales bacterium]
MPKPKSQDEGQASDEEFFDQAKASADNLNKKGESESLGHRKEPPPSLEKTVKKKGRKKIKKGVDNEEGIC